MERLVNFWVILILRLSLIKSNGGNFNLDRFLSLLNKSIFESFKALCGEHGLKLVISTPVIPLILLSAFTSPIKAQMFGQKGIGSKYRNTEKAVRALKITNFYMRELSRFASRWWFIREVFHIFQQPEKQVQISKTHEPHATHTMKCNYADKLSIGALLSAVNDAETALALQLTFASIGSHENIIVEDDDEDEIKNEETADLPLGENKHMADPIGLDSALDEVVDNINAVNIEERELADELRLIDDQAPFLEFNLETSSQSDNSMRLLLVEKVDFDISDMAEMVTLELNFIPTVMDLINMPHTFP